MSAVTWKNESSQDRANFAPSLVLEADGAMKCYLWPRSIDNLRQSFGGDVPPGTVAIAHTHPEGYGQRPSRVDQATPRATHLPIFVLSLWETGEQPQRAAPYVYPFETGARRRSRVDERSGAIRGR